VPLSNRREDPPQAERTHILKRTVREKAIYASEDHHGGGGVKGFDASRTIRQMQNFAEHAPKSLYERKEMGRSSPSAMGRDSEVLFVYTQRAPTQQLRPKARSPNIGGKRKPGSWGDTWDDEELGFYLRWKYRRGGKKGNRKNVSVRKEWRDSRERTGVILIGRVDGIDSSP